MALKQRHYHCIELMLANPNWGICKLAEELGVNRNTVADWKKNNKEFQEEYKRRLHEMWEDCEGIAINTMKNLATDGSFQASKYILDSLGYAPAHKIEADINQDIIINIE